MFDQHGSVLGLSLSNGEKNPSSPKLPSVLALFSPSSLFEVPVCLTSLPSSLSSPWAKATLCVCRGLTLYPIRFRHKEAKPLPGPTGSQTGLFPLQAIQHEGERQGRKQSELLTVILLLLTPGAAARARKDARSVHSTLGTDLPRREAWLWLRTGGGGRLWLMQSCSAVSQDNGG